MAQMGKDTLYTSQSQSNKYDRERKEFESHFGDPRYCRQAWQSIGQMILARPASKPIPTFDKNGEETYDSLVESYSYRQLQDDYHALQSPLDEREAQDYTPTNLEMILMCQAVRARSSVQSATFVRVTVGAKPIDESKQQVTVDDYSHLTDEELALLVAYRQEHPTDADHTTD